MRSYRLFRDILFAVFVAAFIRWVSVEPYVIPTPSMEKNLLAGDFLVVSKLSYGIRFPSTLLQIPLTHGKIWLTGIDSYLDWIQIPSYRLFGGRQVGRGDAVVFNYPMELERPPDLRTHYVKRCVALPGDTLLIRAGELYINGSRIKFPEGIQYRYELKTSRRLRSRIFERYDIQDVVFEPDGYTINTTPSVAKKLKENPFVESIERWIYPASYWDQNIFPKTPIWRWNQDFFGPLVIPKKGMRVHLGDSTLPLYREAILHHEENEIYLEEDGFLYDERDKRLDSYVFQKDYYFMMGDNRYNSEDSRFWGFVPMTAIVGKPALVILSFDKNKPWYSNIRWDRLFHIPN
ncbi:MAG: signal peptidase I [Cytophagales bacterium]|nr:signal peptidase I [Cytophagales bacterium]